MIELTGIPDIDNLINNYKGSHEIFKDNELYDYNSFNLSRNYRTVGELISSSSYTLDTWGKTRDGYTFNFKTHESYSILFTIITMYILCLFMMLVSYILNRFYLRYPIYILIHISGLHFLCVIYCVFIHKDIALISINKDGIMFYKGKLFTKLKNFRQIYYSFDEINIKLVKGRWRWMTYHTYGWGSNMRESHGFAIRLFIEKTLQIPEFKIKMYKEEADILPAEFDEMFISYQTYINNLLQFPIQFIEGIVDEVHEDEFHEQIFECLIIKPDHYI